MERTQFIAVENSTSTCEAPAAVYNVRIAS